jgi:LacI family transcriptional regulator
MKITSNELARLCGVSRATVDRVFNHRGIVNEETRNKVLEAAKSVGYRPNHIAQSLVTGKTFSIGIAIPSLNNYFFSTLLNAASKKSQENHYIPLVTLYGDTPPSEYDCILNLIERQVDGIILFPTEKSGDTAKLLKDHHTDSYDT